MRYRLIAGQGIQKEFNWSFADTARGLLPRPDGKVMAVCRVVYPAEGAEPIVEILFGDIEVKPLLDSMQAMYDILPQVANKLIDEAQDQGEEIKRTGGH